MSDLERDSHRHDSSAAGREVEITILPDGRVYAFGICREVLDLLRSVGAGDAGLSRRLTHVRGIETGRALQRD